MGPVVDLTTCSISIGRLMKKGLVSRVESAPRTARKENSVRTQTGGAARDVGLMAL